MRTKEKSKKTVVMRCVCYMSIAFLELACLLSACTTEIIDPDNPVKGGPEVVVKFKLSISAQENDSEISDPKLRSSKPSEPITDFVRIPHSNNVYLYATLDDERPVTTRVATAMNVGAHVRIIAFAGAPNYTHEIGYADYRISNAITGELTPLYGTELSVPQGGPYLFLVLSFNDSLVGLPTHTPGTGMNFIASRYDNDPAAHPLNDLLTGTNTIASVSSGNESVPIILSHTFSRVRVRASSEKIKNGNVSVSINEMRDIRLSPGYNALYYNTNNRTLTPTVNAAAGDTTTYFRRWQNHHAPSVIPFSDTDVSLNYPVAESDYIYIFTNGAGAITLTIDNLKVDNKDLGTYALTFSNPSNLPLRPGGSYCLQIDFARLVFAGSNIYWDGDGQRLTFDSDANPVAQGRQGVYFKWGSLIGISPRGDFTSGGGDMIKLYVPNAPNGWSTQTLQANTAGWSSVAHIPYVSNVPLPAGEPMLQNYLSSPAAHLAGNPFKGDICKYLSDRGDAPIDGATYVPGSEWRMPNVREFVGTAGNGSAYDYDLNRIIQTPVLNQWSMIAEDGKTMFHAAPGGYDIGATRQTGAGSVYFPHSGSRNAGGVPSGFPGGTPYLYETTIYLSGSPASASGGTVIDAYYHMRFDNNSTAPGNGSISFVTQPVGSQGVVRCVKTVTNMVVTDLIDWESGGQLGGGVSGEGDTILQ